MSESRVIHGPRSFDRDEFLLRPLFAHLATVSAHGPRDSPVWFVFENEAFWIIGDTAHDSFPGRIASSPACALGIVDFDATSGRVHHLAVRGQGTIETFDNARARRIFTKYMGEEASWDPRFVPTVNEPPATALLVRITADTMLLRDQSYRPRR